MVTPSDLNPFGNFNIGLGSFWNYFVLFAVVITIIILCGILVFILVNNRKYKYKIPLYSTIGNIPTKVKVFKACDFPVGKAGDKLWFVKGAKKFIPPAEFQSAPNEFPHYLREDGEWINFQLEDLNEKSRVMGLRFLRRDMSLARLSTDRLLEQRLMQQGFWEKWGVIIGYVIFFLVITISMVIFFYELSKVVEGLSGVTGRLDDMLKVVIDLQKGDNSLVPVTQLVMGVLSWVL